MYVIDATGKQFILNKQHSRQCYLSTILFQPGMTNKVLYFVRSYIQMSDPI